MDYTLCSKRRTEALTEITLIDVCDPSGSRIVLNMDINDNIAALTRKMRTRGFEMSSERHEIAFFGSGRFLELSADLSLRENGVTDEVPYIFFVVLEKTLSSGDSFSASQLKTRVDVVVQRLAFEEVGQGSNQQQRELFALCMEVLRGQLSTLEEAQRMSRYLLSIAPCLPAIPVFEEFVLGATSESQHMYLLPALFVGVFRQLMPERMPVQNIFSLSPYCCSVLLDTVSNFTPNPRVQFTTAAPEEGVTIPRFFADAVAHLKRTAATFTSGVNRCVDPRSDIAALLSAAPREMERPTLARTRDLITGPFVAKKLSEAGTNALCTHEGKLYVRRAITKDTGNSSVNVWRPSEGEQTVTVSDDADVLESEMQAEEAIVVLLDTSMSMNMNIAETSIVLDEDTTATEMSRIRHAKNYFGILMDRFRGHRVPAAIGLITFSGRALELAPISTSLRTFEAQLETIGTSSLGLSTCLFDAIALAIDKICSFKERTPSVERLRVLSLTDGNDLRSAHAHRVPEMLMAMNRAGIVYDCISLALPSSDNERYCLNRALVLGTGGYFFQINDSVTATEYFESEMFLRLKTRAEQPRPSPFHRSIMPTREAMIEAARIEEKTNPSDPYPHRPIPHDLERRTPCTNVATALSEAPTVTTTGTEARGTRRVLTELRHLRADPHPNIIGIYVVRRDVRTWRVIMSGPSGTDYEFGRFLLWVHFGATYPAVPPDVRMITKIFHCNISRSGKICHSVFTDSWRQDMSMKELFGYIVGLLMMPNYGDPLDSARAALWHHNEEEYHRMAVDHTLTYATKRLEELEEEIHASE
eukprot:gnl/Chilomastix_cuspidata/740.p1 GENE.gnl/Chilomastix_cuspidata/740~~gnl/Chilomastix_cuspidata/740.p1  ORF type:complete len:815 (-),score=324.28 gnl/Chilomastix_cuspidata/740:25-2469(-)